MRAVIFDMDGTMVDNMMVHHRAWQKKLRELGMDLEISEVKRRVHGVNEEILERLFGDALSPEERIKHSQEKEMEYRQIFKSELKLVDGLANFLDELRENQIPMAIATAAPKANVDFVLDNLNLRSFFSVVLDASDIENGKPDPEIFLKAAELLNLSPQDCLVFEDSPTGASAAKAANMTTIIVTTTHSPDEFNPYPNVVRFIKDFQEIEMDQIMGNTISYDQA